MSGEKNMPVLVQENIEKFEKDMKDMVFKLQGFQKLTNKDVEVEKLESHPFVKAMYLPISFMEMTLDEIFFGLWETKDFKWLQVSNEITATMELRVFHPLAKCWITRTGVAAIQIMTDSFPDQLPQNATVQQKSEYKVKKNNWALDLDNKKAGALTNGIFAALKADCFKNACISLGKYFGRDVNRKMTDDYNPLVPDNREEINELKQQISEAIQLIQDEELRTKYVTLMLDAEANGKETIQFCKGILNELEGGK